jgi:hypothetical protein
VSLKEGENTSGHHFGPDFPQDLEEVNGAEVSHHGRPVSLLLDKDQLDPLPLDRSSGYQPKFLEVLKDLLLGRKRGNLKKTV